MNKKASVIIDAVDYSKTLFSPRWFIENMLYIVNKKNKLIQFKLNEEQDVMLSHIEFCLANDLPIRIIVLKARQIGSTTFFSALGFWFACMNENMTYGIVAHRLDSAQSIFTKCKTYYNNLPKEMRPHTIQMSSDGITFDKKDGSGINSKIMFSTVSEGVFRGQTLSYLHRSECAFWEGNIQAIENSLAPTVSISARTIVVSESTANGYNTFKDDWDRAVNHESEFTPFFFGWQDHAEYVMKVPKGFELTDTEEEIMDKFPVTLEQMVWRRYQINNNYGGNPVWFSQENPMTPTEAFVASGTGVFNSKTISDGYFSAKDPIERKKLKVYPTFEKLMIWEKPTFQKEKRYQQRSVWSEEKHGYVYEDTDFVLEERTYMTPYTIGIDTSGLGSDINQVVIINNVTKRMAGRYERKNISERNLAKVAVEIAKYYNNAMIIPEVNFSHAICDFIYDDEGYKNVFVTESLTRKDKTISGGIEFGFKTTSLSKAPIISNLSSKIDDDPSIIPDKAFWFEAEYYLMQDRARNIMNASQGHHDDIIMATAIALYGSESPQSRQTKVQVKKFEEPDDFLMDMIKKHDPNAFGKKKKKTILRKGVYTNNA